MRFGPRGRRAMCACAAGFFSGAIFWHAGHAQGVAAPDPLAEAKSVVAKCGAGTDVGRNLSLGVTAELTRLVGVGGSVSFDASYFSFVRASIFRNISSGQRLKAYEAYVDCVKAMSTPELLIDFNEKLERLEGQISERLQQISDDSGRLMQLVSEADDKQMASRELILQKVEGLRLQLVDQSKRARVNAATVQGEIVVDALLIAVQKSLSIQNYASADAAFREALAKRGEYTPLTESLWSLKGQIAYGQRNFAEAANALQTALRFTNSTRSPYAVTEDKRLLANALVRSIKAEELHQATDLGLEVARADLNAATPNIEGALQALTTATMASRQTFYRETDIQVLGKEVESKLPNPSTALQTALLDYARASADIALARFIARQHDDAARTVTRNRLTFWWNTLDQLHAPDLNRADAAMTEGAFFQWVIHFDPSYPGTGFEKLPNELGNAAQYFQAQQDRQQSAEAAYQLAVFQDHTKNYTACLEAILIATDRAPAASAIAADSAALRVKCNRAAGLPPIPGNTSCTLARAIQNTEERKDRLRRYCGVNP